MIIEELENYKKWLEDEIKRAKQTTIFNGAQYNDLKYIIDYLQFRLNDTTLKIKILKEKQAKNEQ